MERVFEHGAEFRLRAIDDLTRRVDRGVVQAAEDRIVLPRRMNAGHERLNILLLMDPRRCRRVEPFVGNMRAFRLQDTGPTRSGRRCWRGGGRRRRLCGRRRRLGRRRRWRGRSSRRNPTRHAVDNIAHVADRRFLRAGVMRPEIVERARLLRFAVGTLRGSPRLGEVRPIRVGRIWTFRRRHGSAFERMIGNGKRS